MFQLSVSFLHNEFLLHKINSHPAPTFSSAPGGCVPFMSRAKSERQRVIDTTRACLPSQTSNYSRPNPSSSKTSPVSDDRDQSNSFTWFSCPLLSVFQLILFIYRTKKLKTYIYTNCKGKHAARYKRNLLDSCGKKSSDSSKLISDFQEPLSPVMKASVRINV